MPEQQRTAVLTLDIWKWQLLV